MLKEVFIATVLLFGCLGCSAGNGKLEIQYTGGSSIYLIPSTTQSCYMQTNTDTLGKSDDVSAKYFQVKNPSFVWKDTGSNLYVVAIKVTLSATQFGSNGTFTQTIAGNELASLDYSHAGWNGLIPAATDDKTPTVFPSTAHPGSGGALTLCPLTFGGVTISSAQDVDFSVSGTVQVIGVARTLDSSGNETGEETPVTISNNITVNNIGGTNTN